MIVELSFLAGSMIGFLIIATVLRLVLRHIIGGTPLDVATAVAGLVATSTAYSYGTGGGFDLWPYTPAALIYLCGAVIVRAVRDSR